MQGLEPLAAVVGAPRRLAVDGDEVVPARPQRGDPAVEAAAEQHRIDAIDQAAQPALAGNAKMELREAAQKIEMMLTPGDDIVEVVARREGGAGHQQQYLFERIHDPARLPVVRKRGKMLQKQRHTRPWYILFRKHDAEIVHDRAP